MEPSSIELKVLSSKDLRAFNFFQKLSAYTLVSLVSDDPSKKLEQNQQQRTPNDLEGDGNPDWNHEMRFDLNEVSLEDYDHLFIHFDVRHQGLMFGDKTIGEVHVHLKDLIEESNFGVVRFVSYQVRTTDGRPNGVLSFSCKVNGKGKNNNMGTGSEFPVIHDQQTSHEIHYPSLELQKLSEESLSFAPQQVHFLLPGMQYPSYRAYHPPPDAYYPPPPPPPPHGACYHPSCPQWAYPWAPDLDKLGGGYDYYGAAHGTPGSPVLAESRGTDNDVGEAWSNSDSRAGNGREDPFWNGRGWKGYLELGANKPMRWKIKFETEAWSNSDSRAGNDREDPFGMAGHRDTARLRSQNVENTLPKSECILEDGLSIERTNIDERDGEDSVGFKINEQY